MTYEIKPCPECGALVIELDCGFLEGRYKAVCRSCNHEGPPAETQAGAINRWNEEERVP